MNDEIKIFLMVCGGVFLASWTVLIVEKLFKTIKKFLK